MLKLQNQFHNGDQVEILKEISGPQTGRKSKGNKKVEHKKGTIIQVCKRFATIDFGSYRESFYLAEIRKVS